MCYPVITYGCRLEGVGLTPSNYSSDIKEIHFKFYLWQYINVCFCNLYVDFITIMSMHCIEGSLCSQLTSYACNSLYFKLL